MRVFTSRLVMLPGSAVPQAATIEVSDGKITAVHEGVRAASEYPNAEVVELADGKVLIPGLVDAHVHLNQPGRTHWEGFTTGTTAAISGGVTTLIDMPLNSIPPTTTVDNLEEKRLAAIETGVWCDVGFWGGIVPGNQADLVPLIKEGVKGFKCFLINSGVDEFPHVVYEDLVKACDALKDTSALVLFHAELAPVLPEHEDHAAPSPSHYSTFLDSRPPSYELDALALILKLAGAYPAINFHIVHLSAAGALPVLREARRTSPNGLKNLTVETCFHYLCLEAEGIKDNCTQYKCCPPIREAANRELLWNALLLDEEEEGGRSLIDYIVSDHSPCTPELKKGSFMEAWGGVSGLGLGLSLVWTELERRSLGLDKGGLGKAIKWLAEATARQVGLEGKKGVISVGADADLVVFDPSRSFTVEETDLHFKNKVSPYLALPLRGVVEQTYLRGEKVWDTSSGGVTGTPRGLLL